MSTPINLNSLVSGAQGQKVVLLLSTNLHQTHVFFTKITSLGGSNGYFGADGRTAATEFRLNIGCFSGAQSIVSFSDNSFNSGPIAISINSNSHLNVFAFTSPTINYADPSMNWCGETSNSIV